MPETIAPGRDFRRHWRRLGRRIWLNTPAIAPAADVVARHCGARSIAGSAARTSSRTGKGRDRTGGFDVPDELGAVALLPDEHERAPPGRHAEDVE
jgi:hypothetical protein